MNQPGHRHVLVFTTRINQLPRSSGHLLDPRDDLATNGTIRVVTIDQVKKIGRDCQGKLATRLFNTLSLRRGQVQQRLKR